MSKAGSDSDGSGVPDRWRIMDNFFKAALIISLFAHTIVLGPWNTFPSGPQKPEKERTANLNYVLFVRPHIAREEIRSEQTVKETKGTIDKGRKSGERTAEADVLSQKTGRGEKTDPLRDHDKTEERPEKKAYLRYLDVIRENIRFALHQQANIINSGEAVIKFTVSPEGVLIDIGSIHADTLELSEHVDRAMREASPFPSFPEGFGRKPLTFSLTVKVM